MNTLSTSINTWYGATVGDVVWEQISVSKELMIIKWSKTSYN